MAQRARSPKIEAVPTKTEEKAIMSLVKDLKDGDLETRLAAARELSDLGLEHRDISIAYGELSRRLLDDDEDPRVRQACARALGAIPTSDSIRTLGQVLEWEPDYYVAVDLAGSLQSIYYRDISKGPEVLAALMHGLTNEDALVRRQPAAILAGLAEGETGEPLDVSGAYAVLKLLLGDEISFTREACARALACIATEDSERTLRAALQRETDESVVMTINDAIRRLSEARGE